MSHTSRIPGRGTDIRSVVKTAEIPGAAEQVFDEPYEALSGVKGLVMATKWDQLAVLHAQELVSW